MTDPTSKKRILIVNAWGGNRGDEAMLNALYRILRSINDNIQVDVLPFRNEPVDILRDMQIIPGKYGVDYYSDSWVVKLTNRIKGLLRKTGRGVLRTLSYLGQLEQSFLQGYDLILSAPQGPTISDIYSLKHQTLYPLDMALRAKIPYAILGVSMGPFDKWTIDQHHVHKVLAGAWKILVREDISLSNVTEKYPDLKNVDSAIDIVFADVNWKTRPVAAGSMLEEYKPRIKPNGIGACISR